MPDSTLEIECFLEAVGNYVSKRKCRDKARDEYEGYSWGYYGSSYENDVAGAAKEVSKYLKAFILDVVKPEDK